MSENHGNVAGLKDQLSNPDNVNAGMNKRAEVNTCTSSLVDRAIGELSAVHYPELSSKEKSDEFSGPAVSIVHAMFMEYKCDFVHKGTVHIE